MHTDIDEKTIARRLNAVGNESSEAPYDWTEFQRRRHRSMLTRTIERNRPVAIAASVLAAVLVTALPYIHSTREHEHAIAPPDTAPPVNANTGGEEERTRAIEGWLAGLPHDHAIVRVGAHAAVTGLQ